MKEHGICTKNHENRSWIGWDSPILVEVVAQTGLKVAMACVECGHAPWPPQHGSSDQHARALQDRHVVIVVLVRTSSDAGRRWLRRAMWVLYGSCPTYKSCQSLSGSRESINLLLSYPQYTVCNTPYLHYSNREPPTVDDGDASPVPAVRSEVVTNKLIKAKDQGS